jgi:serpin B
MKKTIMYLCAIPLLCWACGDAGVEPDTPVAKLDIPIEPQEKVWAAKGNAFAVDLLAKAVEEAGANKENVMLSPLSLQLALGMLANGVTDEAFAEMASAMGFDDATIGSMNAYFHKLSAALTEGELDCV